MSSDNNIHAAVSSGIRCQKTAVFIETFSFRIGGSIAPDHVMGKLNCNVLS
jgi:hypothetical protein